MSGRAFAQAPATQRQTPPPGISIADADRQELTAGAAALAQKIGELKPVHSRGDALLPDVEIFHKAVDWALRFDEFFDPKQVATAHALLAAGTARADALSGGGAPWTAATGLVVRGYRSRIDGSVQPYGLVVPAVWKEGDNTARPLWLWLHGRNEKLTELAFIDERLKKQGEFAPANAFVLHLYGRFCNASKFAGEADLFEALAELRARYSIDPNRIVVAGFSMGGAAAWHFATHYAGIWVAASPGAGFAETATYAKVFAEGKESPRWWEQVLWRLYDATAYAGNLANCPLIAYSGDLDPQKQSADIMEQAMAAEGLKLERVIGPQTAHKYEPETKKVLARHIAELVAKGREEMPPKIRFTTYTLRYHKMEWIEVDALEKHWERADINAELLDEGTFRVTTQNVAAFRIALPVAPAPLDKTKPPRVVIDEQELAGPPAADYWAAHFRKTGGKWALESSPAEPKAWPPSKTHGLTGPIDDAFMDSFIFVRPTGKPLNDKVGAWANAELERAIVEWRRVFRGDARVIDDQALTPADLANSNIVLWGDPSSNSVLAKILPKLPLVWTAEKLALGTQAVSAADHAPILIQPNPLNPQRYVVLNSSFTFREGSNTSNSLQTPKRPDWAVIDLNTPPSAKWPGLVVDAGFFDERWQFSAK